MPGQITNGKAYYEQRTKTGEFEWKHASAQLDFTVPEGEDHQKTFDLAMALVQGKVRDAIGVSRTGSLSDKDKLALQAGGPLPDKPPRKTAEKPPTPAAPALAADPAAIPDPQSGKPTQESPAGPGEGTSLTADPGAIGDDVFTSAPTEVTEKALTDAIGHTNGATKNTLAIRALIGKYTAQDGKKHQSSEIAADKRAGFLEELKHVPITRPAA